MATLNDWSKMNRGGGWWGVNPPPGNWGGGQWITKTVTTNGTGSLPPEFQPTPPPVDEEQIRKIVRQELHDLMPVDVPDAPPEDL